jgi:hypothetical protein
MSKRETYKALLYIDLFTIGVAVVILAADAFALGKLTSAAKDDPSRSEVSASEASSPEPDSESGD